MATNLPTSIRSNDSAADTRRFFETYTTNPIEFNATDVEAAVAFFEGKGFGGDAALSVSGVLLKQAKADNIPIFQLLDRLGDFSKLQLSALIAEILNNDRTSTSTLGFKQFVAPINKIRNVSV